MSAATEVAADAAIFVVGAGIMGAGIAQIAAQAGHAVWLYDTREGAADAALANVAKQIQGQVAKGRMSAGDAGGTIGRLHAAKSLEEAAAAGLVVEAIVENLGAKRELFGRLEAIVSPSCILASNTSSISITAIANGLKAPARLVGMHFFNPVPAMKLVEVVSGLLTDALVAKAVEQLALRWGKTPAHAKSTPGFIVNRIARPYYAETLALLAEQAAKPDVLDACLRGAGFRMGPCELMDLIGHDTNFAVTQSVFAANYFDRRFGPSQVQQELVEAGLLGRKTGQGFYRYEAGQRVVMLPEEARAKAAYEMPTLNRCVLHGSGPLVEALATALPKGEILYTRQRDSDWHGVETTQGQLRVTDGRSAAQVAAETSVANVAVVDQVLWRSEPGALAWALSAHGSQAWAHTVETLLRLAGWQPVQVADCAGLVVARTVAMLINEAADAVLQGVCTADGADTAMKLGANYPAGPHEWLAHWGASRVVELLDHLDTHYRGERYRVSPALRQSAWRQKHEHDTHA
jgi:3-hydroxybutyryl-CoA dehydrogenase